MKLLIPPPVIYTKTYTRITMVSVVSLMSK